MSYIFGSHMKKRLSLIVIVVFISLCLIPGLAMANELGSTLEVTAVPIASVAFLSLGGYMLWKNRLSQPEDAKGKLGYHGPGEFYFGGFLGASFVPNMDWDNRKQIATPGRGGIPFPVTTQNIQTNPGPVGGLKCGYFFDSCPYLGLELEGSIASNNQPHQTVHISPPVNGSSVGTFHQPYMYIWTMAGHIVGRYGFLQDQEVPFGRLQPYVGIGPGVGVLYFSADSAKNFSLDVEAGLRYMLTKHFAVFMEYKYFHQWDVQLFGDFITINGQRYNLGNGGWEGKQSHFDFNNHKIVVGLEYHF